MKISLLCVLAIGAALLAAMSAGAADGPQPYEPAGATSTPKVEARWDFYRDCAQAEDLLRKLNAAYPGLSRLESIGKSYGGREMWVLTITNFDSGDPARKPGFWIDGGIHANELQGPDVVLYTCWYLLEMYGKSDFVRELVDRHIFYCLPVLNPDGRDFHFYQPNDVNSPRSGLRPVDEDRDGLFDEDGPDDLNGDGSISMMRKQDPHGRFKPDEKYPMLMRRCEPGEQGEYMLLGEEGTDNDGDGVVNEDGPGGGDPNRDYPWRWQPRYIEGGAFRYPLSFIENRSAADFVMAHPNIAGGQSFHNMAGMVLRGPGDPEDQFPYEDIAVYDVIGKKGAEILPGYTYGSISQDLYTAYGTSVDWLYNMQGALSFTNELNTSFNYFSQQDNGGWFGSREEQAKFNELLLFGNASVPWQPYDHPQYGAVEIGGYKKTWGRQPASFMLEEECHRNMAFVLYHASQLPQLEVESYETKDLGGGLTELTATIVNRKLIPSRLMVDVLRGLTRPDEVSLEGGGLNVVMGSFSEDQFFQHAQVQKREGRVVRIPRVGSLGAVYVRWLLKGPLPEAITAGSVKGGTHTLKLK